MESLPPAIQAKSLLGNRVMRHKPELWNGIWSDMYIAITFMRYGDGPVGVIGSTLHPSAMAHGHLASTQKKKEELRMKLKC